MAGNTQNRFVGTSHYSPVQLWLLVFLRVAIGWQFLYEGLVKLFGSGWSAAGYLAESKWIFSGIFHWIVAHPTILNIVDFLNVWGLILIGLGLILGGFTRLATVSGILLLTLYYVANPPLVGYGTGMPTEGHYLIVDKTLIELFALAVLVFFPTGHILGLDRLLQSLKTKKAEPDEEAVPVASSGTGQPAESTPPVSFGRRELVKGLATLPFFGAFTIAVLRKYAWESYEEKHLMAAAGNNVDAVTAATTKTFQFSQLKDLKGKPSYGQIGNLKLSRIFLGGNLIGGWAHARDLIYVSKLVKAYHSDRKVFDTLRLAEQCGINALLTNPQLARVINQYWRKEGGTIQFISDCGYKNDIITGIKMSIDAGAHACYIQGEMADRRIRENKPEEIAQGVELIRKNGLPAGIGAHCLETIKACVDYGLKPDFWVKTLHQTNYWSANSEVQHDNIWCVNPEETIEYMQQLTEPWIAFKVLAAGAIPPQDGFQFAFQNGADFICVGMYDFQIVEDVNLALEVLKPGLQRQRAWCA